VWAIRTGRPLVPAGAGSFYSHPPGLDAFDADRLTAANARSAARKRGPACTAGGTSLCPNDAASYEERRPRSVARDGQSDLFELSDESRAAQALPFPGAISRTLSKPARQTPLSALAVFVARVLPA
jgi:hypothetical protein